MTIDKNKDEEYQFPDQEEYNIADSVDDQHASTVDVDQGSVISSDQDGLLHKVIHHPFMHNKRMIAIIALVLVVMVVVVVIKRDQTVSMNNTKTTTQNIAASKPMSTEQSIMADLTVYSTKIASNQNSIQRLSSQIRQASLAMSALQSQQAQIISMLHPLQQNLIQLNAKMKKINLVKAKKKTKDSVVYFVKAIIPGRAWLVSSSGLTASVGKGEYLKGYGKILTVDVNDGIVYTSSGRKIRYSKRDF